MKHLYADTFVELAKEMEKTEGPSEEQIAMATALAGKKIKLTCGYTGTVIGPNLTKGGFYNGAKYPVMVCVDEVFTGEKNVTFEYTFEDIVVA